MLPPAVAGIGLLVAFGTLRPARRAIGLSRHRHRVHQGRRRARGHLRREPLLRPHGCLRVRGDRADLARCRAHARCRAGQVVLPSRAAAGGRRPRRRGGARVRSRDRRVRGHDHVRRLAPGRHPDAVARDLRAVRPRLRRRTRYQRCSRRRQRRPPPNRQARSPDGRSTSPSPSPSLLRSLRPADRPARDDDRARRPVRGREDDGAAGHRRPAATARGHAHRRRRPLARHHRGHDLPPERRRVGYLFQEYALFPHLDVSQNVRFGALDRSSRTRCSSGSGISHLAALVPATSPAASGNVSRLPVHSRATRRAPARRAALGARRAHQERRPRRASPSISATSTFRRSSSRTTSRTRQRSPTDRRHRRGHGSSRPEPPPELVATPTDPFVASFTGANLLPGQHGRARDGLTEVVLDGGATALDRPGGSGRVTCRRLPLGRGAREDQPADSRGQPPPRRGVASLVALGNRVRVRVGPIIAEVTVRRRPSVSRSPRRELVVASFKATAARLVPLSRYR